MLQAVLQRYLALLYFADNTCKFFDCFFEAQFADLILYDFKHIHPLKHTKFTGVGNQKILENLQRLNEQGKDMFIRIPVIPGFNDSAKEMEAMAKFISQLTHLPPCHLLPYHALGVSKYKHLGSEPNIHSMEGPSKEQMKEFRDIWIRQGIDTQIGG